MGSGGSDRSPSAMMGFNVAFPFWVRACRSLASPSCSCLPDPPLSERTGNTTFGLFKREKRRSRVAVAALGAFADRRRSRGLRWRPSGSVAPYTPRERDAPASGNLHQIRDTTVGC